MYKKDIKNNFIKVNDMILAATLVSKGYELRDCKHSPKHKRHTYMFDFTEDLNVVIQNLMFSKEKIDVNKFLESAEKIHEDFHGGCNDD